MANGTLAPSAKFYGFDDNGDPLVGGLLYTYAAGTTTPVATYLDVNLTVPNLNTNPIVLDSGGRATIFLVPGSSYKFLLKTSAGATVWTQDNILATPTIAANVDIQGTAGENLTANDVVYLSAGDGGRVAGSWYRADATNTYSSTAANAIGIVPTSITMSSTGTIRLIGQVTGYAGLSAGALYYISATTPGAITSSAPANARAVATADSTTSLVISQFIPNQFASATQAGIVSTAAQTLGAGLKNFLLTPTFGIGGTSSFLVKPVAAIYGTAADVTPNVTTQFALTSFPSVPAGTLNVDGMSIRFRAFGKYAANGNAKIINVKVGNSGSLVDIFTLSGSGANFNNKTWSVEGQIWRQAAAKQRSWVRFTLGASAPNTATGAAVTATYEETQDDTVLTATLDSGNSYDVRVGAINAVTATDSTLQASNYEICQPGQ